MDDDMALNDVNDSREIVAWNSNANAEYLIINTQILIFTGEVNLK